MAFSLWRLLRFSSALQLTRGGPVFLGQGLLAHLPLALNKSSIYGLPLWLEAPIFLAEDPSPKFWTVSFFSGLVHETSVIETLTVIS